MGWRKHLLRNKDFSKSYVDVKGELKNFNVDLETVKYSTLVTS